MLNGIEALTTKALSLALDAASLRQQAIAANIANAGTPGYSPLKVDFESQLETARRGLQTNGSVDSFALSQVRPVMFAESAQEPEAVRLDTEMAALAENSVQYQALLKGLSRQFSILSAAVSDGKK